MAKNKEDALREISKFLKMKEQQNEQIRSFRKIDYRLNTTGGLISNYLLVHKKEIIELSDNNPDAKYICDYFKWLERKATKEDLFKEISEILREKDKRGERIRNIREINYQLKTNGNSLRNYLIDHKQEIIQSIDSNMDAKYICDYFGWLMTQKDILREIVEYLQVKEQKGEKINHYRAINHQLKTKGGSISRYLNTHKREIMELAETNLEAKYICDYFGWLSTKEDTLKEIAVYLKKGQKVNCSKVKYILKTTGSLIGSYLGNNKQEIIELAETNLDAKYICDYFGWLKRKATVEEILQEIVQYLKAITQDDKKITSYQNINYQLRTRNCSVSSYLAHHKKEIIELAINGNNDAKFVCNYFVSFQKKYYEMYKEYLINCKQIDSSKTNDGINVRKLELPNQNGNKKDINKQVV